MAIKAPSSVALASHQVVSTFQIRKDKRVCPQKRTPRKRSFCSTKKRSRMSSGMKATKSVHPGKPSQAGQSKIPDKTESKIRCIRFILCIQSVGKSSFFLFPFAFENKVYFSYFQPSPPCLIHDYLLPRLILLNNWFFEKSMRVAANN